MGKEQHCWYSYSCYPCHSQLNILHLSLEGFIERCFINKTLPLSLVSLVIYFTLQAKSFVSLRMNSFIKGVNIIHNQREAVDHYLLTNEVDTCPIKSLKVAPSYT